MSKKLRHAHDTALDAQLRGDVIHHWLMVVGQLSTIVGHLLTIIDRLSTIVSRLSTIVGRDGYKKQDSEGSKATES